jgi:hypothetical protein
MIDIQKFCADEDEPRYYLQAPFKINDRIIATNGHIIISIPDDGRDVAPANASFAKSVERVLATEFAEYVRMDSIALPDAEICERCPDPAELEEDEVCCWCEGTGISIYTPVLVGATTFARRYMAMIAELPDAEIGISADEKQTPVPFRFTGGHGCLMPMRTK